MSNQEIAKDIVVAMMQNGLVINSKSNQENAESIAEIFKTIHAAVKIPRN